LKNRKQLGSTLKIKWNESIVLVTFERPILCFSSAEWLVNFIPFVKCQTGNISIMAGTQQFVSAPSERFSKRFQPRGGMDRGKTFMTYNV
jgi:hypothetical protein